MHLSASIAKGLLSVLRVIRIGRLRVVLPDGSEQVFGGTMPGPAVTLTICGWDVISRVITHGDVGFAEDYRDGKWECDDLPALLTLLCLNERELGGVLQGTWWAKLTLVFKKLLHGNSISKTIQNSAELGSEFYQLWLDTGMHQSSALFGEGDGDINHAHKRKYQRILEKLDAARHGGHILEIGCGWGGFMEEAVQRDYQVTGITPSKQQLSFVTRRLGDAIKNRLARLQLLDYREIKERFDYIVSIEMFEAVGERHWPSYFQAIRDSLKRGGRAVVQTATIDESIFPEYRKRSDMIQHYSFPGGMLPSPSRFVEEARAAGLRVLDSFEFGKDYAQTLRHWLERFDRNHESVRKLGFDEGFIRLWRFYLSYCIAGFATGRTQVYQYELAHAA